MTAPGLHQEDFEPYWHDGPLALPTVVDSRMETAAQVLLASRRRRTFRPRTWGNPDPARP